MAVKTVTVGPGVLSIGSDANLQTFESQVTEVALRPKVDNDDPIYVLSGESVPGDRSESWTLAGSMLQDFGSTSSKTEWLFTHRGEVHPFKFIPNSSGSKQITGSLVVEAVEIGGKAKTKATSDFEFAVVGDPVIGTIVP